MDTSLPVLRTTSTERMKSDTPGRPRASSTLFLSGTILPPRTPWSAVISRVDSQSMMRPARASGEKPPNTTECTAPMRAQASMAMAASGIIGM